MPPALNMVQMTAYIRQKNPKPDAYGHSNFIVANIPYRNIQDLLARFFLKTYEQQGALIRNWRELCIGINSNCFENGTEIGHTPTLDYDGKDIKTKVKEEVTRLQKDYDLGDAYLYNTRNGMHVYFFSDVVSSYKLQEIVDSADCCEGFKNSVEAQGYATLRVSAKYTKFDIEPYKVLPAERNHPVRLNTKAIVIQQLIKMGQECGTHIASLYPQWAAYREDPRPWPRPSNIPLRRKKMDTSKAAIMEKKFKADRFSEIATTTTTTTTNLWALEPPEWQYMVKKGNR